MNVAATNICLGTATALTSAALTLSYAGGDDESQLSAMGYVKGITITTNIKAEMIADNPISALSIKVETDSKGVVHLSGSATSQSETDRAVMIALGVRGVTAITNDILILNKNKQ